MPGILDHNGNPVSMKPANQPESKGWYQRRWEAATTDRLNKAHWANADGTDINTDLVTRLHTLRKRISYETANNPIVRGMLETHKTDLIGPHGPRLNVIATDQSGNSNRQAENYARILEDGWREWWARPDLNQELTGPDLLRQDVEMLWQCGEFICQFVTDASVKGPVKTRLHPLHPGRIGTHMEGLAQTIGGRRDVILGIERSKTGKALFYHLDETPPGGMYYQENIRRLSARNILHEFRRDEPGQIRGVPWIASALQTIADLRDYDLQVLDAARQAADSGIVLSTVHPDVEPLIVNEDVEVPRRRMVTAPPGWTPTQVRAEQPTTGYPDYRRERHLDLGRPVAMPGMITRLDSSKHNFSSARFDAQSYDRANEEKEAWLERVKMNRLVRMVEAEMVLAGVLPAERPASVEFSWAWGAKTHRAGDPGKEANAAKTRMEIGLTTLSDELEAMGKHFETHIKKLAREAQQQREAGVLPTSEETGGSLDRAVSELFKRAVEEFEMTQEGQ